MEGLICKEGNTVISLLHSQIYISCLLSLNLVDRFWASSYLYSLKTHNPESRYTQEILLLVLYLIILVLNQRQLSVIIHFFLLLPTYGIIICQIERDRESNHLVVLNQKLRISSLKERYFDQTCEPILYFMLTTLKQRLPLSTFFKSLLSTLYFFIFQRIYRCTSYLDSKTFL